MSRQTPKFAEAEMPRGARVAVVAARFNAEVVDALLEGCLRRLKELGLGARQVAVHRVPGAFELPLAAKALTQTRKYKAVICLGAVIRGQTPHFDYVAGECARGIAAVSLSETLPVIFGVLTTNNRQQAWDRCGGKHGHAGIRAAEAAVEMMGLIKRVRA